MTIEDVKKQRVRTATIVVQRHKVQAQRKEELVSAWRIVAPRLIALTSCVLPRGVVKIKFGGNTNEFKIIGNIDGGYTITMDSNMSLKIVVDSDGNVKNGQVQFVEKDPPYTQTIYSSSVCNPMIAVERGSLYIPYLILHWDEIEPLFIKNINNYLLFWETLKEPQK